MGRNEPSDGEQRGKRFMWEFFGFLCQRKQQTQSISQGLPSAARLHRQPRPAPACLVLPLGYKHSSAACTGHKPWGSDCTHLTLLWAHAAGSG